MENRFYIALVHCPVKDKNGREITSAVTNLDIHDLSRLAKTYGVNGYYIITPDKRQRDMVNLIADHWRSGYGAAYNGDRKEALEMLKVADSIESLKEELTLHNGRRPVFVSTGAAKRDNAVSFPRMRKAMREDSCDYVVLFGTGWGLSNSVFELSDYVLEPIDAKRGYNHLSVRSAASIVLDRLLN